MKLRATVAAVVLATVSPLLAAMADCPDVGEADCCDLDGSDCVCCPHSPRIASGEVIACRGDASGQPLGPDDSAAPQDSFPRDILHVPRSTPVR